MDDMTAGYAAGTVTVLLASEANQEVREHEYTGVVIERLDDLIGLLEEGLEERR